MTTIGGKVTIAGGGLPAEGMVTSNKYNPKPPEPLTTPESAPSPGPNARP